MAELSDADKRVLLGADYKARDERRDALRAAVEASATGAAKSDAFLGAAAFAAIVSALIFFGDYFRPEATRKPSLEIAAAVVFVLSAAIAVWRLQRARGRRAPSST